MYVVSSTAFFYPSVRKKQNKKHLNRAAVRPAARDAKPNQSTIVRGSLPLGLVHSAASTIVVRSVEQHVLSASTDSFQPSAKQNQNPNT